jgi:hypothetical protein
VLHEAILHLEAAQTYKVERWSTLTLIEAECCLHLGSVYGHLYDPSLDNVHYLDKSIESSKRAVALSNNNNTSHHRAIALFNLAKQQCRRYDDLRNEEDLIEAGKNVEKARELVKRGYGTRDLPQGIEELGRYVALCRQSVVEVEDGDEAFEVGLSGKKLPCSMSRYYLRAT